MFRKSAKKKSLDLKVRISYDEKTDTINLKSKDRKRRLDLSLRGLDADHYLPNLHYFLEREGIIPEEGRFQTLPENLNYTHAINTEQWDKFPLGRFADGEEVIWDTSLSSNLFIAGSTGTGKSVIQRNIIFHCLRHPENWEFYGVDLLRVEMTPYLKYGQPIKRIVTTVSDALAVVTKAHTELNKRYRNMEQEGVNNFRDLDRPKLLPAWMIMMDEASFLLANTGSKTDEGKAEDALREELKYQLDDIALLGRAAGIYLVLSTQRVDLRGFTEAFKGHFGTRIATGRMDEIASTRLLDNNNATRLNRAIKGRGYFQQYGEGYDFQSYFATSDWPYEAGIVSRDQ